MDVEEFMFMKTCHFTYFMYICRYI